MKHLKIEDIIQGLSMNEEILDLIKKFVFSYRGSVTVNKDDAPPGKNPEDAIFKDLRDVEDGIWEVSHCDLVQIRSHMYTGGVVKFVLVIVDLWGHAGYPGGETSKYFGRVEVEIEELAFVLSLMNMMK
jgi:hypothetical protein